MDFFVQSKRTVAVFGLTGDPFTVAHRAICKKAINALPIDKLYVIPTVVDYHREGKNRWLSDGARLECMRYMLWSLGDYYLNKWEIDRHEIDLKWLCGYADDYVHSGLTDEIIPKRRFIHTLLDFKTRIGMFTQIMLILGTGSVKNLTTWYRWKEVCHSISSLVVVNGRDGETIEIPSEVKSVLGSRYCNLSLEDEDLLKVSASKVREACLKDRYTVDMYRYCIEDLDRGITNLKDLGWI